MKQYLLQIKHNGKWIDDRQSNSEKVLKGWVVYYCEHYPINEEECRIIEVIK